MNFKYNNIIFLSLVMLNAACTQTHEPNENLRQQEDREPEPATGIEKKAGVLAKKYMVTTANPYASQAGFNVLEKGGSAIDAAIAVQLVLTLVEPQSSGIGGGAFILHWDNENKKITSFDGRETAPAAATSRLFLDENGKAVSWINAVVGGRSVGVPGVLAALKNAHEQHGKLAWNELFVDAIKLAENGFIVSPRLAKLIGLEYNPGVKKLANIKRYFYPNGKAIKAGDLLKNVELANTYKSIASEGVSVFYEGWIAENIVNAVQYSDIAPGKLTLQDMKSYVPNEVTPVCGEYRTYNVCGMAPPSSGGVAVVQMLGMLNHFDLQKEANNTKALHLFTQSSKLAFADRNKYIADPQFTGVPVKGLLDKKYLAERAALINPSKDLGIAKAGKPNGAMVLADDNAIERPSTSHFSIVDAQGNAISMTTSVEMAFGSAVMVNGFILNNQLTDFSLSPKRDGKWVANRVEASKRPRSSMAPTMVFNQDESLVLLVGSPGGSRIINYTAQTIIGILDWGLSPQEAINLPKITNRNKVTTLEKGTDLETKASALKRLGHKVVIKDLNSGLHVIKVTKDGLEGGADPRREGKVLGF